MTRNIVRSVTGWVFLTQVVLSKPLNHTDNLTLPVISTDTRFYEVTNSSTLTSLLVGSNATFYCNGSVELVCRANASPFPTVSWLFNGQSIDLKAFNNRSLSLNNNSLVIRTVVGSPGAYTCLAHNTLGNVSATSYIKYTDPDPPQIYADFKNKVFTKNNNNASITVGTNATMYAQTILVLLCNASGSPSPKISWKFKGSEDTIEHDTGTNRNKLLIPHNPENSGEYSCEAENVLGQATSSSYIEFIEPMPPVIISSRKKLRATDGENHINMRIGDDLTTISGTSIDVKCPAGGIPEPDVTWYHNGDVCRNSQLIVLKEEKHIYHKAISLDASGNYTCVARNGFGNASATSYIEVIDPVLPYINSSAKDVVSYDMTKPLGKVIGGSLKSLVGVSIWLTCPMGGIPPPRVTWEKDYLPVSPGKRLKVTEERIEVLGTIMSDTGWYSCIATNGAGTTRKSTFVQLIAPVKPRIKREEDKYSYIVDNKPTPFSAHVGIDLRILAYREVTIHCSATGFPAPVLSWQKNGRPIVKEDNVFVSESGDKLFFRNFKLSQNGVYSCVATNAAGRDVARSNVLGRLPLIPKVEIRKTVLSKSLPSPQRNIRVYEIPMAQPSLVRGSNVILECVARRGYPGSVFQWFKNGKPLRRKTTNKFNGSKLKLKNIQRSDEGTYKCFAKNILGQHETSIEIRLHSHKEFRS